MKIIPSVLLVDDDVSDLVLCELTLGRTKRFPRTFRARTGEQVLALFTRAAQSSDPPPEPFPPDLMFVDVHMPAMTGLELVDELLRLRTAAIVPVLPPIVMLSASLDPREEARAVAHPAVLEYMAKPMRVDAANRLADRLGREIGS
ncbi:MAG: response regulator [Deltaproteobacteria bacterium]|nr:response regulator [Deltaproteobacteria bacterium]